MSSDTKQMTGASPSLILEVVAGTGHAGSLDGTLSRAEFRQPYGLCRVDDSLIVTDFLNHTIRQVTGVFGVTKPVAMEDPDIGIGPAEFESRAVPLLMTVISVLPKELARLTAQYANPSGRVITIAGVPGKSGHVDGRAIGEALFDRPTYMALDESDPVGGPRLIIGEFGGRCVRSLTLRSGNVTTLAGSTRGEGGHVDGPGSEARFSHIYGVAVGLNGTVFVSERTAHLVRRISPSPERTVTTLIGHPSSYDAKRTRYAPSSAECFREPVRHPWALAVHMSDTNKARSTDLDRDVGVLYVGCFDGVHAFDLTRGEHKRYALPAVHVTGLAVTEDGARLFAVAARSVHMIDTHTGACTSLVQNLYPDRSCADGFRAGVVSDNIATTGHFGSSLGCLIDKAARSLVMVDFRSNHLIRMHGIDV